MRLRLFLILSVIFFSISIAFALNWNKVYHSGPDEQKGDYIFYCIQVSLLITLFYMVFARLLLGKAFPLLLIIIAPIILVVISIILAVLLSPLFGDTNDVSVLRVFLIIHSISTTLFVSLFAFISRKAKGHP